MGHLLSVWTNLRCVTRNDFSEIRLLRSTPKLLAYCGSNLQILLCTIYLFKKRNRMDIKWKNNNSIAIYCTVDHGNMRCKINQISLIHWDGSHVTYDLIFE